MPLTFWPDTDTLVALATFILQFAELEYAVNMGIIEAESISDQQGQAELASEKFHRRTERLERAFNEVEDRGIIQFHPLLPPSSDLISLARKRNHMLHGSPWTLIRFAPARPDAKPGDPIPIQPIHVSHTLTTGMRIAIDVEELNELAAKAESYATCITFLTADLALAKRAAGQQPLTFNA